MSLDVMYMDADSNWLLCVLLCVQAGGGNVESEFTTCAYA
jgi:hypothetical protein